MKYQDLCDIAYCYIPPFVSKAGYINEEVNRAIEAIQIAYEKEIKALLPKWENIKDAHLIDAERYVIKVDDNTDGVNYYVGVYFKEGFFALNGKSYKVNKVLSVYRLPKGE